MKRRTSWKIRIPKLDLHAYAHACVSGALDDFAEAMQDVHAGIFVRSMKRTRRMYQQLGDAESILTWDGVVS